MRPIPATGGALLAALGLSACSLSPAPGGPRPSASTTANTPNRSAAAVVAQANRTHEYPGPPARQAAPGALGGPALAVTAFANGYINWTAATVTGRMRGLAALSVGQARAAMTLAAAQTAQDYELRRSGIANSGTVEAIAPVRAGPHHQYVVVTREQTTASDTGAYRGLRPSWHVALATVTPAPGGGWVVSGWQPEN